MPRRKQGHSQASKRIATSAERLHGKGLAKKRSCIDVKPTVSSRSSTRRGGRGGSRARPVVLKASRLANENATAVPDVRTRYLHKKFQRVGCLSPTPSLDSNIRAESDEALQKGKAYTELRCTDNQNCSKSSTMALEALLQVTELEINKSSAKDGTLPKSKDVSQTSINMTEAHSSICVGKSVVTEYPHTSSSTQNTESCLPLVRRTENLNSSPRQQTDSIEVVQSSVPTFSAQESEPKKSKLCRHVCPYCSHGFAKPSVLKKHIRAHTNERPYPCRLCGFSFKTNSNLYKHCKSRAHVLKANECGSAGADSLPADVDAAHSNSDTEDEIEQLSISENSCDTSSVNSSSLQPEISSVPKPFQEEAKECGASYSDTLSKTLKSSVDDTESIANRPRVPPIKIQTLLHNRQIASKRTASVVVSEPLSNVSPSELNSDTDKSKTPVSHCSIENNDISSAHRTSKSPMLYTVLSPTSQPSALSAPCVSTAISSPPPGKNTSGVSSLIYKPKFHSAIIGGSRKFIDHKNFTLDLSQEESSSTSNCCVPSRDDGSVDSLTKEHQSSHSDVTSSNDGLMLRVLEGKSNISEQQLETTLVSNSSDTLKSLPSTIASETNSVVSDQQQFLHSSSTSTASSLKNAENTSVCVSTAASVGRGSGLSLQVTNKTPIKSPRLVSPELVKQHISNLISANTAIVETLNPLWSRRFLRQSSVASSQNVDAELRARNKHRRYGNYGGGEDLSQSKLANALLRKGGIGLQLTGSQSLPATPSIILTSPPFANVLLAEVKTQLLNIEAARTSPVPNPVVGKDGPPTYCEVSGSVAENPNVPEKVTPDTGNATVLSTSGDGISDPASSESSANEEKPGSLQHPQNPEGSIIKNLLLTKRRSPSITSLSSGPTASPVHYINSHILTPGEIAPNLDRATAQTAPDSYSYQFHTCPVCHTSFRSMETLQAHQSHYCQKIQRLSPSAYIREPEMASVVRVQCETSQSSKGRSSAACDVPSKPRGRPKGSKNRPKELLVIPTNPSLSQSSSPYLPPSPLTPSYGHVSGFTSPHLTTDAHGKTLSALKGKLNFRQGNEVPELNTTDKPVFDQHSKQMVSPYNNETSSVDNTEDGAILKKHLLLGGLSGDKSPPLKKRRIPDEGIKNNSEPGSTQNSVSTLRSLEELSRYPMRSNSVQLFGGEVEICDSGETKKMRIDAKLQHPVPSGGGLVLGTSSPALSLQMMPVLGSRCPPSATCTVDGGLPSPSVVVTIAKLVLNSGGTMMQVQESKSHSTPPVCIPVVALGHPHTSSEMAAASDRGASPMAAFSEGSLSSSKFSEVGAVILSPSITTVHSDKVAGIHSIDISHLQLCSTTTLSYSSPNSPLVVGHNPSSLLPHNQFAISRMTPSPSTVYSPGKRRLSSSPLVSTSGGATITMPSSLPPLVVVTGSSDSTARAFLPSVVSSIISLRSSPSIHHSSKEDFTVRSVVAEGSSDQTKLISIQSSQPPEEFNSATTETKVLKNATIPIIQIDSAAPTLQPKVSSTTSTTTTITTTTTTTPASTVASSSFSSSNKPGKAFLAPPRPTSLPLKSSHSSMVGTTLISPETPRPKKKYGQLYINGQYYTYLGLKCSTRVYYCCIYRPQPMYVPQSTDPKLSMYSNWQTVPVNPDKINLTPAAAMACYDSRHRSTRYAVAGPKKLEYLLTHSSYWTFKQQKGSAKEVPKAKDVESVDVKPEENAVTIETSEAAPLSIPDITPVKEESQIPTTGEDPVGNETSPASVKQKRPEASDTRREPKRVKIFEGGFKSNEEYTYVRGRGRGKYVCEECGIRCKKPSMLKKHIRTHTDVRPFTCKHCNFSFKTKGNLTKHMKSKAHHKKCIELGIDPVPVSIDEAHIDEEALAKQERYEKEFGQFADDDDTDEDFDDDDDEDENEDDEEDEDDDEDSFDEDSDEKSVIIQPQITRPKGQFEDAAENLPNAISHSVTKPEDYQLMAVDCPAEHEAARSLLDLSNHGKPGHPVKLEQLPADKENDLVIIGERPRVLMTPAECKAPLSSASGCETEELIGNPRVAWQTSPARAFTDRGAVGDSSGSTAAAMNREGISSEHHSTMSYAVYMLSPDRQKHSSDDGNRFEETLNKSISSAPDGDSPCAELVALPKSRGISRYPNVPENVDEDAVYIKSREGNTANPAPTDYPITEPIITLTIDEEPAKVQVSGPDFEQPMDLSVASARVSDSPLAHHSDPPFAYVEEEGRVARESIDVEDSSYMIKKRRLLPAKDIEASSPRLTDPQPKAGDLYEAITPPPADVDAALEDQSDYEPANLTQTFRLNGGRASSSNECAQRWDLDLPENENNSLLHAYLTETDGESKVLPGIVMSYHQGPDPRLSPSHSKLSNFTLRASPVPSTSKYSYLQSSANSFHSPSPRAQSASPHDADVSGKHQSEFLLPSDCKTPTFSHRSMDDGKCVCNICNKSFTKPSQLRLHVNIHYFERPFRCDSCAVSFRTKGHLQKHRRSVSHYNKVNMNMTFGTPTTDNPRPFKCGDCKIAFRIHGHLAKHLRSKMHIMKLECLGKLPFGTYAEIERSGVNLNEIDTTDCENSLESLQVMAQRMYEKDPRRQHWTRERTISGCSADDGSDVSHVTDDSIEGGRYRSLSLGDAGRLTPEYRDMDDMLGNGGPGLSEVKQEPSDVHGSGELFHQKQWDVMHHSSMESLGQEYEDISDAESEPEPSTSCTYCGQIFRSVKALHLHVYVEHPEGRELPPDAPPHLENNKNLPQTRAHCPMRVRSMSMSDNPALSMEVRTGNFPGEMSVAMEMRRNMFTDGAAIAMEIRRNSSNFITEISASECRSIPHESLTGLETRRAPTHPAGLAPIIEHCPSNVADVGVVMPSRKVNNIPERVDCGMLVSVSAGEEEVIDHNLPHLATVPSQTSIHVHALPDSDKTHISCNLCEKKFTSRSSLKQHMITHVQLRPFICEVCDAGFISKEYLWHHHQTHNHEKESINQDGANVPNCKENHHTRPLSTYCVRAEEDTVR